MVMIELREAAYDKAFDLLDEIKDLGKKKRMALCELEDAMYECYEASKDKEEDYSSESESKETVSDMDYRRSRSMRKQSMYHEDPDYYDYEAPTYGYRRRGSMRMRSRQGRYSY